MCHDWNRRSKNAKTTRHLGRRCRAQDAGLLSINYNFYNAACKRKMTGAGSCRPSELRRADSWSVTVCVAFIVVKPPATARHCTAALHRRCMPLARTPCASNFVASYPRSCRPVPSRPRPRPKHCHSQNEQTRRMRAENAERWTSNSSPFDRLDP